MPGSQGRHIDQVQVRQPGAAAVEDNRVALAGNRDRQARHRRYSWNRRTAAAAGTQDNRAGQDNSATKTVVDNRDNLATKTVVAAGNLDNRAATPDYSRVRSMVIEARPQSENIQDWHTHRNWP